MSLGSFYNGVRCDGRTKDFDSFGIAGSIPVAPTNYEENKKLW